jgi:hypothetical protein
MGSSLGMRLRSGKGRRLGGAGSTAVECLLANTGAGPRLCVRPEILPENLLGANSGRPDVVDARNG